MFGCTPFPRLSRGALPFGFPSLILLVFPAI